MDQKNHPMMIEAFSRLAEEFPDKNVYIYGEGSKREELQSLIDSLGMSERILLPGNSNKIFDVMHEYEYFVMCSDYEGLSNALLEAMISGMVCATTAWNGVEEFVDDGVNGYLTPVGDIDSLSDKLRTVFTSNNDDVRRLGIETGSRFCCDAVMSQWHDAIESLI